MSACLLDLTCQQAKQKYFQHFFLNTVGEILIWTALFNRILPSVPTSSNWSLSFRFPHQSPVCIAMNIMTS